MSASEKLKGLKEDYEGSYFDPLRNALPQIVAAVEAAEEHAEPINKWGQTKLGRALTALEEALGGDVT